MHHHIPRNRGVTVFFLDVSPLCYEGNKPSSQAFGHWISLFFSQVSLTDPVIAVIDGEEGNQRRRELLPSYKAHRKITKSWELL
ncbi:putative DNA polymerase A, PIN-like domain superfamily [Arabidopsis thaliana]